ncbi:MAG: efflux RND transporter periplasmic adaptor subunit [Victivallaceae bacterium]|nr:efflux RND transporter periplasmic adaptor subunit [Victivallaceae bacterium]
MRIGGKTMTVLAALLLLAAAAAGGLCIYRGSCGLPAAPEVAAPRVVKLVRMAAAEEKSDITYPGRVKPVRHAELFFRVSGPVIERNLKYGQTVEQGDVLMRIDPRDYEREVDRLTQELEMEKIQNSLDNIELERNKELIKSHAVSRSTYDAAETRKRASDARVKMLEVSLRIAQDKLKDTVLVAPFHGTVSDLMIEQYEIAHANVPVVVMDDLREIEIHISVPAGNLPDASIYDAEHFIGMKFNVTFPGRGDRMFQAAVYEFKPVASEQSETYEVTLRMPEPDNFLILPGMTAEVHGVPYFQELKARREKLILPFAAIFNRGGRSSVWVYHADSGKLELREVATGSSADADSVYVESGLKPGEYVVAAGGDWLTADTAVKVMNPEIFHDNH